MRMSRHDRENLSVRIEAEARSTLFRLPARAVPGLVRFGRKEAVERVSLDQQLLFASNPDHVFPLLSSCKFMREEKKENIIN